MTLNEMRTQICGGKYDNDKESFRTDLAACFFGAGASDKQIELMIGGLDLLSIAHRNDLSDILDEAEWFVEFLRS